MTPDTAIKVATMICDIVILCKRYKLHLDWILWDIAPHAIRHGITPSVALKIISPYLNFRRRIVPGDVLYSSTLHNPQLQPKVQAVMYNMYGTHPHYFAYSPGEVII